MYIIVTQCIGSFIKLYCALVLVVTVVFLRPMYLRFVLFWLYNYLINNCISYICREMVKVWLPYFFTVILSQL